MQLAMYFPRNYPRFSLLGRMSGNCKHRRAKKTKQENREQLNEDYDAAMLQG
jgi:hypothetical protein